MRVATNEQQPPQHRGVIPVVFLKNRDLVNYADKDDHIQNEEVYIKLSKTIRTEYIQGVQRIGGLWQLYTGDHGSRCKLIAEGTKYKR